jgi:hypothetical protein
MMILGVIPRIRICITWRAVLVFHRVWTLLPSGARVASAAGNQILWSTYRKDIGGWADALRFGIAGFI